MQRLVSFGLVVVSTLPIAIVPAFAQRGAPGQEAPQRGGQPKQDTPYILIATFHSPDRALGVQTADETRKRVSQEHSAQELFVILKRNINATLQASGYAADSALNASDLMELARQLHGEYVLDATATRKAPGIHVEPRLMLRTGQNTFTQPLPGFDAKDAGDAAKTMDRELSDALKGIKPYRDCVNFLRAQKWEDAAKAAQLGIQAYSNSSLSRMCLLTAATSSKAPPDSVINVANAILAIDSMNTTAMSYLADAYTAKGEATKATETMRRLYKLDPTNRQLAMRILAEFVKQNAFDQALAFSSDLLKEYPGDPEILEAKWKVLLAAGRYKEAIPAAEELVKADSSKANAEYFTRQIGAAQRDSNATLVQQYAARASQKFPKEISFANILAQSYLKAGQLQQALDVARRASQIDPKSVGPWQLILAIQSQLNQTDSMLATAQKAFAAGVPKDSLASSLLATVAPALKKAQETKERADWEAALKAAQTVDAVAPSPQTKFYVGFSSFYVGADALTNIQKLYKGSKDDKAKACAEIKVAEESFATTNMTMVEGGRFNKDVAGQILGNLNQTGEFISQVKTALKCK